jgi:hypothetical protein
MTEPTQVPDFTFFPTGAKKKQIAKTFGCNFEPSLHSLKVNLATTVAERFDFEEITLSNRFDEIPVWKNTLSTW